MPKIKQEQPDDKPIEEQAREHNKSDVEEMLSAMGSQPQQEEDESKETEEPKNEEQEQEQEETEKPKAEQSEGDEEEESQNPDKDEVIQRLRSQIEEMSKKGEEEPKGEEESKEPKGEEQEEQEEQESEQVEFESQEFVSEEEFDDIIQDRSKLNEVLNRVALESANATREAILRQLPGIIDQSTSRQLTVRQSIQKFYTDNPDLQEYGSYVGHIANKVRAEKPDAPMVTVLNEAGEQARKDLGIQKEAKKTEEERRKSDEEENNDQPAFAKRGSGPRSGGKNDDRSDFVKQADEMLKHIPGR